MYRLIWTEIEGSLTQNTKIDCYLTQHTKEIRINPILDNARKIWESMYRREQKSSHVVMEASLWNNLQVRIDNNLFKWGKWVNKGYYRIGDLFNEGKLLEFKKMQNKYQLTNEEWYRYIQLRSCLTKVPGIGISTQEKAQFMQVLEQIKGTAHIASKIYNFLINGFTLGVKTLQNIWCSDLNMELDEEEWLTLMRGMYKPLREAKLRLMQFKIINKIYWTPAKMHIVKLRSTKTCWNCDREDGDLIHMFWNCNQVKVFWKKVLKFCSKVLDREVPVDESLCLLHKNPWDIESDTHKDNFLWLILAIATAKRVICRHWKDKSGPNFTEWQKTLVEVAEYERTIYKLRDKLSTYEEIWEPFLSHLEGSVQQINGNED
uniref:Reverse transcriptase zinc-binding domain-containing protein n=1 Tax=Latimeria chalumnae TaxID=7897 RepID=H3A336_LATCH